MKKVIVITGLAVSGLIALGAAASDPAPQRPAPTTPAGNVYSSDVLARASRMTQQMSVNGPLSGHEYHNHGADEQLQLSSDPQFLRELEGYQVQIDRMLARNP